MPGTQHRRRVGTVRPSHLMFTGGVGALIDLPNFPVLVRGLDDWRFDTVPDWEPLHEPRLLAAVAKLLSAPVTQLRPPPWLDGFDADPNGQAARVGVPVIPFPQWLRCTACNRLAPLDSGNWVFVNDKARRPDEARFFHQDCPRRRSKPLAVAARFVLACVNGHLDDFPYREFVHNGGACPAVSHPQLQMEDYGGNRGANVIIRCPSCRAKWNISRAMGHRGAENLPVCRGRHPHLSTFENCAERPMVLVVGASNQWFAQTLSALAVPQVGASALQAKVEQLWGALQNAREFAALEFAWTMPQFDALHQWSQGEVFDAIAQHRKTLESGPEGDTAYPDLRTPEWEVFSCPVRPEATDDFTLRRDSQGGILIYTAVPDAEGTLGGLVSLAEPEPLTRIMQRALRDALRCSSDPLCAERLPKAPADFLHGAACHACLFVSETTCERGNRFLDRRFIVPMAEGGHDGCHDRPQRLDHRAGQGPSRADRLRASFRCVRADRPRHRRPGVPSRGSVPGDHRAVQARHGWLISCHLGA